MDRHQQQRQQQQQQQQRDWLMVDPDEVQEVGIEHENGSDNNMVDEDDRGGGGGGRSGGGYGGVVVVEREHMFDKVVTPSDVGKLNRLVIPKQHAEKYFPLDSSHHNNNNNNNSNNNNNINNNTTNNNNNNCSSSSNNNNENNNNKAGLLLNFEDRTGKSWRFRYSYWNSSQSYVMTKGWSRFVKEKQLSAGDIVSFQRAVGDDLLSKNTFFIDWRRRPPDHQYHHHHHHHLGTAFSVHHSIPGWMRSSSSSGSSSSIIIPSPITRTPTLFLRSHPHESHPHHHHNNNNNNNNNNSNAIWDHSSYNNNNNNISNMNNNVAHLSMVPYAYGGSGTPSVVNPSGSSLILLRSPVSNPSAISHPHLVPNYPPYLHHLNASTSTTSSNSSHQGGASTSTTTPTMSLFDPNKIYDSVPVVHGKAPSSAPPPHGGGAAKRSLRLFGVNMEYDHHHHPQKFNDSMDPSTSNFNAP
ncbi:hypothetical protein vseg_020215 [Gypsophila vaccaria]